MCAKGERPQLKEKSTESWEARTGPARHQRNTANHAFQALISEMAQDEPRRHLIGGWGYVVQSGLEGVHTGVAAENEQQACRHGRPHWVIGIENSAHKPVMKSHKHRCAREKFINHETLRCYMQEAQQHPKQEMCMAALPAHKTRAVVASEASVVMCARLRGRLLPAAYVYNQCVHVKNTEVKPGYCTHSIQEVIHNT